MSTQSTTHETLINEVFSPTDGQWEGIFTPASKAAPDVMNSIGLLSLTEEDVCTGKLINTKRFLQRQHDTMIRCQPVDYAYVMRVLIFAGTWARAASSPYLRAISPKDRKLISVKKLARIMRDDEHQVAYALAILSKDGAVRMTRNNGVAEFYCDTTYFIG